MKFKKLFAFAFVAFALASCDQTKPDDSEAKIEITNNGGNKQESEMPFVGRLPENVKIVSSISSFPVTIIKIGDNYFNELYNVFYKRLANGSYQSYCYDIFEKTWEKDRKVLDDEQELLENLEFSFIFEYWKDNSFVHNAALVSGQKETFIGRECSKYTYSSSYNFNYYLDSNNWTLKYEVEDISTFIVTEWDETVTSFPLGVPEE